MVDYFMRVTSSQMRKQNNPYMMDQVIYSTMKPSAFLREHGDQEKRYAVSKHSLMVMFMRVLIEMANFMVEDCSTIM